MLVLYTGGKKVKFEIRPGDTVKVVVIVGSVFKGLH